MEKVPASYTVKYTLDASAEHGGEQNGKCPNTEATEPPVVPMLFATTAPAADTTRNSSGTCGADHIKEPPPDILDQFDKTVEMPVQIPEYEAARNREADPNPGSVVNSKRTVKPTKLMAFIALTSSFGVAVGAELPCMNSNNSIATTEHHSQNLPKAKMSGGDQSEYIFMLVFSISLMVGFVVADIFKVQRRLENTEMNEAEEERYDEIRRNKEDKAREGLTENVLIDARDPLRKYPRWAQEMDNNFARRIVNQATGYATDQYGEKEVGDEVQSILRLYRGRRGESLSMEFNERAAISCEEKQRLVRKLVFWRVLREAFSPWSSEKPVLSADDVVAYVLALVMLKTGVLGLVRGG